jgi:cathepsin B
MNFAKRRGFVPSSCYERTDGVCPEDNFENQECRKERDIYKLVDFCMAQGVDGVKRELIANGPVIAQVNASTDFLSYSEGVYYRTADAFRFKGSVIVKVIGWELNKGKDVWLVEPFFGSDWGQKGIGKIASGETEIDMYAVGFAVVPFSERMEEFIRDMQANSSNGLGE